jgi:hypothetical protein
MGEYERFCKELKDYKETFLGKTIIPSPPPAELWYVGRNTFMASLGGGIISGLVSARNTSLQYTAENAHKKPTTKQGWFYYHRTKNYKIIFNFFRSSLFGSLKYGSLIGSFFFLDVSFNMLEGEVRYFHSPLAGLAISSLFSFANRLPKSYSSTAKVYGLACGAAIYLNDYLKCYLRGVDLTYAEKYKPFSLFDPN